MAQLTLGSNKLRHEQVSPASSPVLSTNRNLSGFGHKPPPASCYQHTSLVFPCPEQGCSCSLVLLFFTPCNELFLGFSNPMSGFEVKAV